MAYTSKLPTPTTDHEAQANHRTAEQQQANALIAGDHATAADWRREADHQLAQRRRIADNH